MPLNKGKKPTACEISIYDYYDHDNDHDYHHDYDNDHTTLRLDSFAGEGEVAKGITRKERSNVQSYQLCPARKNPHHFLSLCTETVEVKKKTSQKSLY